MSPEIKILRDLAVGRSTAAAIADRYNLQPEAVTVILTRLIDEEKVTIASHLAGSIPIYQLTRHVIHP
jgi:hypothetical protein